jgi:type I restriction enzyme S subunit
MSWKTLPFTEVVADETSGNEKTLQRDFLSTGKYPIIDQGQKLIAGFTDDQSKLCKANTPITIFGDHTKCLKFIDFPFCLGADGTKILRPKIKMDERYLFYYLQTIRIPDAGYSRHFKFLKKSTISFPSEIEEQRRITAILDKADAIRRKRQQALNFADEFLKSVFLEMFGDPVTNPKGWELSPFPKLAEIDTNMVSPKEIPYIDAKHVGPEHIAKQTGVIGKVLTAREERLISGKYLFDENHILYTKIRPYLQKVSLPDFTGICSADIYPIRAVKNRATKEFLWSVLISDAYVHYYNHLPDRSNIPKINMKEMNAYMCIDPPYPLQQKYSKAFAEIAKLKVNLQSALNGANNLFASLSQRAFRGEL